jgi:hypothetical protein
LLWAKAAEISIDSETAVTISKRMGDTPFTLESMFLRAKEDAIREGTLDEARRLRPMCQNCVIAWLNEGNGPQRLDLKDSRDSIASTTTGGPEANRAAVIAGRR